MATSILTDKEILERDAVHALRCVDSNEHILSYVEVRPDGSKKVYIELHKDFTEAIADSLCTRHSEVSIQVNGYNGDYEGVIYEVQKYGGAREKKDDWSSKRNNFVHS